MSLLRNLTALAALSCIITGCHMLPSRIPPPFLAEASLQQAEMAGAAAHAPAEYQQLCREYSELEKLFLAQNYKAVDKRLPLFEKQAEEIIQLAQQNKIRDESNAALAENSSIKSPPSPPPVVNNKLTGKHESERAARLRSHYTVSKNELLWTIAERPDIYGDPLLWPLLYQANRDQIKDPRKIYAGQTLSIPRNTSEEERENARNFAKKSNIFSSE